MHPELGVIIMVGMGLGAILYYLFGSGPEQVMQNIHRPHNANVVNNLHNDRHNNANRVNRRNRQTECIICTEYLNRGIAAQIIPCGHVYHRSCIEMWRNRGVEDASDLCPLCRNQIANVIEID